jgi:hypothetical protein
MVDFYIQSLRVLESGSDIWQLGEIILSRKALQKSTEMGRPK